MWRNLTSPTLPAPLPVDRTAFNAQAAPIVKRASTASIAVLMAHVSARFSAEPAILLPLLKSPPVVAAKVTPNP
jgi:hypothetical protein